MNTSLRTRYALTTWLLFVTTDAHAQNANANFMNGTGSLLDAVLASSVPVKIFTLAFAGTAIYAGYERSVRSVVGLIVVCLLGGAWANSYDIMNGVMGK